MIHLIQVIFTALALTQATPSASHSNPIPEVIARDITPWPTQSFKTIPTARPPHFKITKSGEPLAPGYILFTPLSIDGAVEVAAVIMSDDGTLIWNSPTSLSLNFSYTNLFIQSLDSKPVLHYWTGGNDGTMGYGHVSILDETYTEIYRVCPEAQVVTLTSNKTFPCYGDIHESFITDHGSIIMSMYNITQADLRSVNGPEDGWVYDSLFYEVDIKTNKTLFRWSALEAGIPFNLSKAPLGALPAFGNGNRTSPYDWFHVNSVQPVGNGYLVNGRHMWTTYMLNSSGAIEWEIQGDTGGDFILPENGHFSWEHHARVQNVTETDLILHYMNNFNAPGPFNGSHQSEGLELHLNLTTKTATVLKNLVDLNESIYNDAMGTFDPLPNGNTLLGYGQIPAMKEFGPVGNNDVRMTIRYGVDNVTTAGAQSYRIYRQVWIGTPASPPDAVVENGVLYMSWNGATGITSWEIFAGDVEYNLKAVAKVRSGGFETMFKLCGNETFAKAAAFRGKELLRYTDVVTV